MPLAGFRWTEVQLPTDKTSNSKIAKNFNTPGNRLKLFDATVEPEDTEATWVPKYPMLSMGVALALVMKIIIPW